MNSKPNRGPMPFRYMVGSILAALTAFVTAAVLWGDHHTLAVTFAIGGVAVLVGNYYVRSRAWREGMLPVGRH